MSRIFMFVFGNSCSIFSSPDLNSASETKYSMLESRCSRAMQLIWNSMNKPKTIPVVYTVRGPTATQDVP